jgi:hypothetical protein
MVLRKAITASERRQVDAPRRPNKRRPANIRLIGTVCPAGEKSARHNDGSTLRVNQHSIRFRRKLIPGPNYLGRNIMPFHDPRRCNN